MSKKLFLTGGNGNIGTAIRVLFEKNGYEVIAPRSSELDLSGLEKIRTYLNTIPDHFDVLIHAAGFNDPAELEKVTAEEIEKSFRVNCSALQLLMQKFIPHWKKTGKAHVLAISSIYGTISRKKRLAYATAKHSVIGMVQTAALELGEHGVLVNSLAPGFVDTQLTRKNNDSATIRSLEQRTALGRMATCAEIAEVAYFLCSAQNSYITGQNIIADGGYTIGGFQNV